MSRFLVDTQLLLWSASGSRKLPAAVARLFREGAHDFHFSAASVWEVAIKTSLGRADFVVDPGELRDVLVENGFRELGISATHAVAVFTLPPIHSDPFDRMLVAQANAEPMVLITADERLARYPGTIEVV